MKFGAFTICHIEALDYACYNIRRLVNQFEKVVLVIGSTKLHMEATKTCQLDRSPGTNVDAERAVFYSELERLKIEIPNLEVIWKDSTDGQFWDDKTQMCNAGLELLRGDVDYVIQMDSDEWYTASAMKRLQMEIAVRKPIISGIFENKVWYHIVRLRGGIWDGHPARVFKVNETAEFTSHRPPALKLDGVYHMWNPTSADALGDPDDPYMDHFCYIDMLLVLQKARFFSALRPEHPAYSKYYQWFKKHYLPWGEKYVAAGGIDFEWKYHPASPPCVMNEVTAATGKYPELEHIVNMRMFFVLRLVALDLNLTR